jgi:putative intracellular protease/amidase
MVAAPRAYEDVDADAVDALLVPGGHAPRMRTMLEAPAARELVRAAFADGKPVGALCHGVLLLARSDSRYGFRCDGTGRSAWDDDAHLIGL